MGRDAICLLYTVQYSADLGDNWKTLTIDHISTTIEIDTSMLPGATSTGLIRVSASDGFDTGSDVSNAGFSIALHAPKVYIDTHAGVVFRPDEAIVLNGRAMDPEDYQIDPASMTWSISLLGDVGSGEQLYLSPMPAGEYEVTLEATDSDGLTSSDSATIYVDHRVSLPLIVVR